MPQINPPPRFQGGTIDRAGIWKCKNAFVGILWDVKGKIFFEYVHGFIGDETDVAKIVEICRTKCVGTYVGGDLALQMWNNYYKKRTSSTRLWVKNWFLIG
ncbi:MAG: hypothetical protein U9N61_03970 [Euryarchaeota archaeon]|nr:hypothetical protein [Euryarchaeota archaeon]